MKYLLLLLSLFHHDQPTKEVLRFTQMATDSLASYQDGSPQSWLEAQQISDIAAQVQYVLHNSHCKDLSKRELAIADELSDLQKFDLELQKNMSDLHDDSLAL